MRLGVAPELHGAATRLHVDHAHVAKHLARGLGRLEPLLLGVPRESRAPHWRPGPPKAAPTWGRIGVNCGEMCVRVEVVVVVAAAVLEGARVPETHMYQKLGPCRWCVKG
eukprot:351003-Chlamydomonas_euryale.AAC.2